MAYLKKFNSGLRLVVAKMEGLYSVTMGIMVGVGSVNETELNNGICHFIEHTTFKGTPKRNSFQINDDVEFLGSRINAFTSKEVTAYHIKSTTDKVEPSFEILSDMFVNALYEQAELDKEKGVICEEIAMVDDTPDELCLDLLSQSFFGNNGYGRTILGSKENVKSFTQKDVLDFRNQTYTAENTVVVFAGNIDEAFAEKLVAEYLEGKLNTKGVPTSQPSSIIFDKKSIKKEIEQTHFALAFKGVEFEHKDKTNLTIASIVLGGGMSSRLFNKIREEQGLCYTIFAYPSFYKDCGSFVVYSGVNPTTTKQAITSVLEEVDKFKTDGITEKEFLRAKNQYLSSLIMSQENNSSLMSAYAKYLLATNTLYNFEQAIKDIEELEYSSVQKFIKEDMDFSDYAFSIVSASQGIEVLK